jgi:hypothetical protein
MACGGSGTYFASPPAMFPRTRELILALAVVVSACDDTGKAIKEEVKEIDKQEVKQDIKESAAAVGSAAKEIGHEAGKAIDKIDKTVAEEIRKD